ncbi:hypothetical protein GN956_G3343 [Arapaima gigas]
MFHSFEFRKRYISDRVNRSVAWIPRSGCAEAICEPGQQVLREKAGVMQRGLSLHHPRVPPEEPLQQQFKQSIAVTLPRHPYHGLDPQEEAGRRVGVRKGRSTVGRPDSERASTAVDGQGLSSSPLPAPLPISRPSGSRAGAKQGAAEWAATAGSYPPWLRVPRHRAAREIDTEGGRLLEVAQHGPRPGEPLGWWGFRPNAPPASPTPSPAPASTQQDGAQPCTALCVWYCRRAFPDPGLIKVCQTINKKEQQRSTATFLLITCSLTA